jgi:endonuclease III
VPLKGTTGKANKAKMTGKTTKTTKGLDEPDTARVRKIDNVSLPHVLRKLRRLASNAQAPVVSLIAVATQDPWRVLASCILSLRTQDATTAKAAERMFAKWPDVAGMARADPDEVASTIYPVGFYRTKAPRLVEMARRIVEEHDSRVPDTIEALLQFHGVGRKTANLVIQAGYRKPAICVDTHVHRIANIWGYVRSKTPDQTEALLRETLSRRYWMEFNEILVAFGQTVCRPLSPKCSECPVDAMCPKIGVERRR